MSARNMKESFLSNCEKSFVLRAIKEQLRIDGRKLDEWRNLEITFGTDWGLCIVSLGKTKVLAQISCDIQQPKATRPNEGLLFIYVDFSPMASQSFETGRQSDASVLVNRLLDKCLKDSRCLDLESLCIVSEEHVWAIRVDVTILNHEGNLLDAACIAALSALAHFRHPDVTVLNKQLVIHDASEKEFIPLTLYHYPICISYSIFSEGQDIVADTNFLEERVSETQIILAVNGFRELCGLHLYGRALANHNVIITASIRASKRALEVISMIKNALAKDIEERNKHDFCGLVSIINDAESSLAHAMSNLKIQLDNKGIDIRKDKILENQENSSDEEEVVSDEGTLRPIINILDKGTAELIVPREDNSEIVIECSSSDTEEEFEESLVINKKFGSESNDSDEITFVKEVKLEDKQKNLECIDIEDD